MIWSRLFKLLSPHPKNITQVSCYIQNIQLLNRLHPKQFLSHKTDIKLIRFISYKLENRMVIKMYALSLWILNTVYFEQKVYCVYFLNIFSFRKNALLNHSYSNWFKAIVTCNKFGYKKRTHLPRMKDASFTIMFVSIYLVQPVTAVPDRPKCSSPLLVKTYNEFLG